MSSPGKLVGAQKLADLHLHELQKLLVVDLVDLVQENHQRRNPDLARQQDVLARLRHRPVRRAHDQDRAVHLRRPRDHVLHVVRMAGAVDMRIVPRRRLVLDMRRRDRDPARLLLRRRVDLLVGLELPELTRDRCRQRRLPVVHVADRPDVHVRLRPVKLLLRHDGLLLVWGQVSRCPPVMRILPGSLPKCSAAPPRSGRTAS